MTNPTPAPASPGEVPGARCPECGFTGPFHIQMAVWRTLAGNEVRPFEPNGPPEYNGNSPARCVKCHHTGKWWQFQQINQSKPKRPKAAGSKE